jgi:hypothetical protein
MGLVIVGGLVTVTLLNLFVVPCCTCPSRARIRAVQRPPSGSRAPHLAERATKAPQIS